MRSYANRAPARTSGKEGTVTPAPRKGNVAPPSRVKRYPASSLDTCPAGVVHSFMGVYICSKTQIAIYIYGCARPCPAWSRDTCRRACRSDADVLIHPRPCTSLPRRRGLHIHPPCPSAVSGPILYRRCIIHALIRAACRRACRTDSWEIPGWACPPLVALVRDQGYGTREGASLSP